MKRSNTSVKDIYTRVTNRIIADLEQGVRPWIRPWNADHLAGRISRPLRACGQPYQGINIIMLWSAAMAAGHSAPIWMTYRQAQELGAHVRKGEAGQLVVYASTLNRTEQNPESGEDETREIPFLKGYTVFNVEQIEGLPEPYYGKPAPRMEPSQRIDHAEAFFAGTGACVRNGGNRAYYTMAEDRVQMPPFETFCDPESYYATLAHECTHWTRHPRRLDRDFGRKSWGDEGYAMEELVAELGSAFLATELDLTPEVRPDHAAYIGSWLKVLKNDRRAIFTAAAHAQRAADYLIGLNDRGG